MMAESTGTQPRVEGAWQAQGTPLMQQELHPEKDLWEYAKAYARQKPEVCALWCFGIGFILGWKLKPW